MARDSTARIAFDLIDEFDRMTEPAQVFERMASVLTGFGFSSFLLGFAPENANDVRQLLWLNGWPLGWTEHYHREQFFKDDPVVQWTRQSVRPFEWSNVPAKLTQTKRAKLVMDTAADFGMRKGVVVPIFQGDSPIAGVSMSGERPELSQQVKRAVHLIGLYAYSSIAALRARSAVPERVLTEGEREVLAWIRDGKTNADIAEIIGIAENTVNWRLNRAMQKLNAANRAHAVVCAIRRKELRVQ